MATLSELVGIIAEVEGLDHANVNLIAREAREAGLIRTGGRGLSAAKMDFSDAANLLIAVNVSSIVRDVPETTMSYRKLKGWEGYAYYLPGRERWLPGRKGYLPGGKPLDDTFGTVLEEVIEAFAKKELPARLAGVRVRPEIRQAFSERRATLRLTFFKPITKVTLRIEGKRIGAPDPPSLNLIFGSSLAGGKERIDRSEETTIGTETIRAVAESLVSPPDDSSTVALPT